MDERDFQRTAWWGAVLLLAGATVRPLQWMLHGMNPPEFVIQPSTDGSWLAETSAKTLTSIELSLQSRTVQEVTFNDVLEQFQRSASDHRWSSDKASHAFTEWLEKLLREERTHEARITTTRLDSMGHEMGGYSALLDDYKDLPAGGAIASIIELGLHLRELWCMHEILEALVPSGTFDEAAEHIRRITEMTTNATFRDFRELIINDLWDKASHCIVRTWIRNTSRLIPSSVIHAAYVVLFGTKDADALYGEYLSIAG